MTGATLALLAPSLIGAGASVGGAAIAAHGQSTAADKQAEAIEKGIALQEKMYNQDRADFAPYRGLGAGAVGNLAYLGGITLPQESTPATTPPTTLPKDQALANLGVPEQFQQGGWGNIYGKVGQNLSDAYNTQLTASQGQTAKVSRNGKTIQIPSTLLPKALGDGWAQVQ